MLLIFFVSYCSYENPPTIEQARQYLQNWQLAKAEKALRYLAAYEKSPEAVKLYFSTLLKEGELKKGLKLWRAVKNFPYARKEEFLVMAAQLYYYLGMSDSSETLARQVIKKGYYKFQTRCVSKSFNILGLNEFAKANYPQAFFYQKKALAFALIERKPRRKADALRQLGVLHWYGGRLDSAITYYKRALKIYRQTNDKIGEATTLSNIGLLYFHWRNWLKEFQYNLQALFIRKKIGDKIGLADSYYFLSHIPRFNKSVGKFKFKFLKKSYDLSRKIGYWWGAQVAGANLLKYFADFNSKDVPFKFDENFGEGVIFKLWQKAIKARKEENLLKLENYYGKIFQIGDSLNYEAVTFGALYQLAQTLLKLGEFNKAETYALKALKLAKNSSEIKYGGRTALELLARLHLKKGNHPKALKILNNLVSYYDSLYYYTLSRSPSVWGYEFSLQQLSDQRSLTFRDLLDAYRATDNKIKFFETLEKIRELPLWNASETEGKNQQSVEEFLALLEKFIGGSRADAPTENKLLAMFNNLLLKEKKREKNISNFTESFANKISVGLEMFQKSLPPKTAFVEFGFGAGAIYPMLIKNGKSQIVKIPFDEKEFKNLIVFYLNVLMRGKFNPDDSLWQPASNKIFKFLLAPILTKTIINKGDELVISPLGILSALPFASLASKSGGAVRYLIESHPIAYAQSASDYLRNKLLEKSRITSYAAFAPNQNRLKHSFPEVQAPLKLFEESKVFLNSQATESNFIDNLMNYDALHFAGHTTIDVYNPFRSALKFYDRDLKLSDFLRYKTTAKLIILSSCSSGLVSGVSGDLPTADDYVSFPRVLLSTGIKGVAAMFWEANDLSTSQLFKNFYSRLKIKGKEFCRIDFARALCRAQVSFTRAPSLKAFRHPFYWAGVYLKY